jgi:hypothetical protein
MNICNLLSRISQLVLVLKQENCIARKILNLSTGSMRMVLVRDVNNQANQAELAIFSRSLAYIG